MNRADHKAQAIANLVTAYEGDWIAAVLDLAFEAGIAIAYITRREVEAHINRELTEVEWEVLLPHFAGYPEYDEVVTEDSEVQSVFIEECLRKAGISATVVEDGQILCQECGYSVVKDPAGAPGVWVHDREHGDLAFNLDENHAATPDINAQDEESTCKHCGDEIVLNEAGQWVDVNGLWSCAPHAEAHEPVDKEDTPVPMRCDQCVAAMINRVFCHETGCPNENKIFVDGMWVTPIPEDEEDSDLLVDWCDTNDCERSSCHRCFPRQDCDDHEKCREFQETGEAYTDELADEFGHSEDES